MEIRDSNLSDKMFDNKIEEPEPIHQKKKKYIINYSISISSDCNHYNNCNNIIG